MNKIKKYGLLEDGSIEPLYYSNGEMRRIERFEGKKGLFLCHDRYVNTQNGMIQALFVDRIVKMADTREELKNGGTQDVFKKNN